MVMRSSCSYFSKCRTTCTKVQIVFIGDILFYFILKIFRFSNRKNAINEKHKIQFHEVQRPGKTKISLTFVCACACLSLDVMTLLSMPYNNACNSIFVIQMKSIDRIIFISISFNKMRSRKTPIAPNNEIIKFVY